MSLALTCPVAFTQSAIAASPVPADQQALTPIELRTVDAIKSDPKKLEALRRLIAASSTRASGPRAQAAGPVAAPAVAPKPAPAPAKAGGAGGQSGGIADLLTKNENKPWADRQYSPCAGLDLLLRQSWTDIGIISGSQCPTTVDKAQGAQITYTSDRIANNSVTAINGTAALVYSSVTGNPTVPVTPYEMTFGVYTTVNKLTNSNVSQAKSNSDTLSYGGVLELGYVTDTGANYFRLRGGAVENELLNTEVANIKFEWLPVNYALDFHYPVSLLKYGLPFIVRFDPAFLVQYDSATGAKVVVPYNNRRESLRVGPQFAFNLFPVVGAPDFVSHLTGLFTYNLDYETYSGKALGWFTGALTYNIDAAGHLGIKTIYKRGRDEDSGVSTNVYMVGLSGKI
jgi:hypothetical protein